MPEKEARGWDSGPAPKGDAVDLEHLPTTQEAQVYDYYSHQEGQGVRARQAQTVQGAAGGGGEGGV